MLKVSITVPSLQRNSEPVANRSTYLEGAVGHLCGVFGGCTATDGVGSWMDDNGALVSEAVTVLTSFVDTDKVSPDETRETLESCARWIQDRMNQDCVLFTIETVDSVTWFKG